jgi:hypothetical protein
MPAGGERLAPLVGAGLPANRRDEQASHQASIRWQASSHKDKRLLANGGDDQASHQANIRLQASSYQYKTMLPLKERPAGESSLTPYCAVPPQCR